MKITINGERRNIEEDQLSVLRLLKLSDVENPELVSVQVNEELVDKDRYETFMVSEKDEIDFLYLMAGGV